MLPTELFAPLTAIAALIMATLVASGLAKLRHSDETFTAMRALQVPRWAHYRWLATALPMIELTSVITLCIPVKIITIITSVGIAVLMSCYLWLVIRALKRSGPVSCACFGPTMGGVLGQHTIIRNVILVTLSWGVALGSFFGWTFFSSIVVMNITDWVYLVLIFLSLALGLSAAWGTSGDSSTFIRSAIPDVELISPTGEPVSIVDLATTQPRLLLFLTSTCDPCRTIGEHIPSWSPQLWPIALHPIEGHRDDIASVMPHLDGHIYRVDPSNAIIEAFSIDSAPAAVLLGGDGLIAGGPVFGQGAIVEFVKEIVETTHNPVLDTTEN